MNIKYSFILILIALMSCNSNQDIKQLSPVGYVSDFGENIFISDNWNIQEYNKSFYFNDYENNKIIVLDSLLKASQIFGKEGKGPGEFSGTGSFTVYEEKIYVVDVGGMRLHVFTLDGKFENTINLPQTNLNWSSFAILNQKIYLSAPVRSEYDILITDLNGKVITEVESRNRSVPFNKRHIFAFEDKIAVLNQVEPVLALYTEMGELINEFDLREIEKLNDLWDHYRNSLSESRDRRHSTLLFKDAYIDRSSIYILSTGWPGRDNFAYILKLEVEQGEIQSNDVFKIQASEEGLSLFDSIVINENKLYALESITGKISEYDLSEIF